MSMERNFTISKNKYEQFTIKMSDIALKYGYGFTIITTHQTHDTTTIQITFNKIWNINLDIDDLFVIELEELKDLL
jgi:hypothetical protein